jgi:hypothetical protein
MLMAEPVAVVLTAVVNNVVGVRLPSGVCGAALSVVRDTLADAGLGRPGVAAVRGSHVGAGGVQRHADRIR